MNIFNRDALKKPSCWSLVLLVMLPFSLVAHAQVDTLKYDPVIQAAQQFGSLCDVAENTLWACKTSKKTYSLCASKDLSASKGYLQYRAGTRESVEFRYPSRLGHPKDFFKAQSFGHGFGITFRSQSYEYSISEDMWWGDLASIEIASVKKPEKIISHFYCPSTGTLDATSMMDYFKEIGIRN